MRPEILRSVDLMSIESDRAGDESSNPINLSNRCWVDLVHPQLEPLLPHASCNGLTTGKLRGSDGRPVDVGAYFHFNPEEVDALFSNLNGLIQTARVIPVKEPRGGFADWPGCSRIEIPMSDGTRLSALIAKPTGTPIAGSWIVIAHGLFGRQYGCDQRNSVEALQAFGHHVLAIEMRGHGMTEAKNPDVPMTFGVDEPRDLIEVDHWLRQTQGATRVGLVGFSLTAHQALLAAWIDSDPAARTSERPLFQTLPPPATQPAFDGGMLLFSPAINLVQYTNGLELPRSMLSSPVRCAFQDRAATRLAEHGQPSRRSMWTYVGYELSRSRWMPAYDDDYRKLLRDVILMIDFTGSNWQRLERVRVPVILVQAADDPVVGSAQAAIDLVAPLDNPNVALIVTKDGGHAGFNAASCSYTYSLIRAFFDPKTAPSAVMPK